MILSYRDKRTAQFARADFVPAFRSFAEQAERRLAILNAAPSLATLRALPGNRLEALKGDRAGQYSIRINQQWRLCFEWPTGEPGPSNVEIVDYHVWERGMFRRAVHPGLILKDELAEAGVTPTEFARQIDVPANRISQIIAGKRSITGDTALRFGHWFGVEPEFWLNLQTQHDLVVADRSSGEAVRGLPTRFAHERSGDPAEDDPGLRSD